MKKRRSNVNLFIGYIAFFLLVASIITCAVLIYSVIKDRLTGNGAIAAIMLAVVFVLAALCTAIDYIRRRIMVDKPVNQILKATEKIAGGDFNIQLTPSHLYKDYNAYDLIMENINKMAKELSHNEVLKTDFISNVSHEIKTPLSVIANYATILQDESLSTDERADCAEKLLAATNRLTDLVVNILKLNKLENQVIREQKTYLRLGDFVSELILGFEEAIDKKNIELDCDIEDISAYADKTFVEIICNNLLSNAVKFTDDGGKISVSLKEEGVKITLSVKDNGCGMDSETGAHIFDKFYQGDTSHSKEGNGLGLALVKRVIDNIGGEIRVKSEVGKGTAFTVKWDKQNEA